MAKVRLALQSMTVPQKVQFVREVVTKSTGNPVATGSTPTLAQLSAGADTLEGKALAAQTARDSSAQATAEQDNAERDVDLLMTQFGNFIDIASGGDEAKILSVGLNVRAPSTTPIGELAQVQNLAALVGDNDGEIDVDWDAVRGAKTYEIHKSADPITPTGWSAAGSATKSKSTVSGLSSGTKYWFRVRGIGAAGPGPWSDPATKVAP
jgi:hypothetical protein